jgi:hypothetical protein
MTAAAVVYQLAGCPEPEDPAPRVRLVSASELGRGRHPDHLLVEEELRAAEARHLQTLESLRSPEGLPWGAERLRAELVRGTLSAATAFQAGRLARRSP